MKHILLIDNDPIFITTVSSILKSENFQVSIAKDGKEAAGELSSKQFDLIITDMLIPYTNGLELVNNIRQNTETRHTPVMVVSGIANEHSIASWFRVGANAYLQKPLNVSALLTGIKQLIVNVRNVAA